MEMGMGAEGRGSVSSEQSLGEPGSSEEVSPRVETFLSERFGCEKQPAVDEKRGRIEGEVMGEKQTKEESRKEMVDLITADPRYGRWCAWRGYNQ